MTGLIAFLISGLSGYYVLRCFRPKDYSFELMDIFLMIGLGLGISAQIVFYVLVFSGHIDPALIPETTIPFFPASINILSTPVFFQIRISFAVFPPPT